MARTLFQNKIFLFFFSYLISYPVFGFRVVLDPGHGGRLMEPTSVYGDKYDPDTAGFYESYRPGATVNGLKEYEDTYEIARLAKDILDLTKSESGRKIFYEILKKYDPDAQFPEVEFETMLSRDPGYPETYWDTDYDINQNYRLYDHLDLLTHKPVPGLISRINSFQPELVVSIHLTGGNPSSHGGLSAVITPGYTTFKTALDYVRADAKERLEIKNKFLKGPWANWFVGKRDRDAFGWFLCDSWIYFTGYWSAPDGLSPDPSNYRGIRQSTITWNYSDPRPDNINNLFDFKPSGKFWKREMEDPESWRRENGPEGYGGDNLYASEELLRFIRKGLLVHNLRSQWNLPSIVPPYISTWSVPTFVNAISAYLEVGYLNNSHDFDRIYRYKKIHAEAIAVGIYSLYKGSSSPALNKKKDLPWGEALDFQKYRDYKNKNYFEMVSGNGH